MQQFTTSSRIKTVQTKNEVVPALEPGESIAFTSNPFPEVLSY
jgi:hypothetical protein